MPAMSVAQAASWFGIMDLYEHLDTGWTLVGGQLVHLHCAERGSSPERPTDDIDTVVDVRAAPDMLATFPQTLVDLGFRPDTSGTGHQHRWRRDEAQIDVLLPDGVGERAALVMKAAAHTAVGDAARGRHRIDFVTLATLIAARDFRGTDLNRKDCLRLGRMADACRQDARVMSVIGAEVALDRLSRAAGLN
jgi:hypothetical protein